ncbi:MAG: hypothetical protein WD359_09930, partial [Dehalococcoidia bacterium]
MTIDFPSDAVLEEVDISITKRSPRELAPPPSPDFPFIAAWSFEAVIRSSGKARHTFAKPLTITTRFTKGEMVPYDPRN